MNPQSGKQLVNAGRGPEAMSMLARSFPSFEATSVEGAARIGIDPWDVDRLAAYAKSGAPGGGATRLCLFLLSVWGGKSDLSIFGLRDFDLQDALQTWDAQHREAFLAWVREPWWP